VQHIAVEPGGDLLFDGAVEAVADGVYPLLVGEFGNLAEVDLVVGQSGELLEPGLSQPSKPAKSVIANSADFSVIFGDVPMFSTKNEVIVEI
jgi:hypothetical protein